MAIPADTVLADLAQGVLDAAVAGMTAGPEDPPDRHVIEGGPSVPWDCDSVLVWLVAYQLSRVADRGGVTQRAVKNVAHVAVPTATYQCQIVLRCYPIGDANQPTPAPAAITAATTRLLTLGYTAREGVAAAILDGTLIPVPDPRSIRYRKAEAGNLTHPPGSPSGGFAAVGFGVTVQF